MAPMHGAELRVYGLMCGPCVVTGFRVQGFGSQVVLPMHGDWALVCRVSGHTTPLTETMATLHDACAQDPHLQSLAASYPVYEAWSARTSTRW